MMTIKKMPWRAMTGLLLMVYAIAVVAAQPCWAQTEPDYLALQRAVAQLTVSPVARSESTRRSVTDLRDRVDAFQAILQEAHADSWGDSAAIQHLTDLINSAAKSEDLAESSATVADINRDLDLKVQYYGSRLGVVGNARGLVKVTIKTLRDGKPAMGLVVYCNPYRWADNLKPMQTFPSLSSPTETSMMAGYYRCFASHGQPEKKIAFRDIAVGLDGSEAISLDIALPQ
jgi:hypothetical protein